MNYLPGLAAAVALTVTPAAFSQGLPANYPDRPIEMVVVYPAGGGMDVTARTLAQESERVLGHQFRVQNRTGGGGIVGHTWLAKNAAPDGYSVGVLANPFLALDILVRDAQFKAADFAPIAGINFTPVLWVVRTDGPLGKMDFPQVIEHAKSKPSDLKIAVIPNNVFDFVASIVEKNAGIQLTHVPFQGGKPGVTALLGGNVDIASAFYEEVEPYIKAGQLKAIAVSDQKRFDALPDVPAMSELGIKIDAGVWGASRFVTVPPATSDAIKKKLEESFLQVMKDPQAIQKFKAAGISLTPTDAATTRETYERSMTVIQDFLATRK
jgi:tripartite-type tricarboxylate transporter receptor subunit TctC